MGALAVECFEHVVASDSAGDDADGRVVGIDELAERTLLACAQELRLPRDEVVVASPCNCRKKDVSARIGRERGLVLLPSFAYFDRRPGVGKTRDESDHHRNSQLLGEAEGEGRRPIGLLLVGRLDARDQREIGVETRILLVLRGMHRRIVSDVDDEAAVRASDRSVDECVCGDVEPDMLHARHDAPTGVAHADRRFEGCLLVGRPTAVDLSALRLR